MGQYENLLRDVYENGKVKSDRTGVGTKSLFGRQIRFDLSSGFPLVTTKKLHTKSIIHELLWFIRGETNVEYLNKNGVRIWNEWADQHGELGPIYGKQWRNCDGVDQLAIAIEMIKKNPDSRRNVVSSWNVKDLSSMALHPCHCLFQFYVDDGALSCQLYQRSADVFLGVPFNIASYALLTHMIADVCDLRAGEFVHTFGDVHLYLNHLEQAATQLSREERPYPKLVLTHRDRIDDFVFEDVNFEGYNPHPPIAAQVAV